MISLENEKDESTVSFEEGWLINSSKLWNHSYEHYSIKTEYFVKENTYIPPQNEEQQKKRAKIDTNEGNKKQGNLDEFIIEQKNRMKGKVDSILRKSVEILCQWHQKQRKMAEEEKEEEKPPKSPLDLQELLKTVNIVKNLSHQEPQMIDLKEMNGDLDDSNYFYNLISNNSGNETLLSMFGHKFLIPKNSTFFLGELENFRMLKTCFFGKKFNVLLIDFPWENKSASRSQMYKMYFMKKFEEIPCLELLKTSPTKCPPNETSWLAIWATNRSKIQKFIEEYLKKKKFPFITSFYWVKVNSEGKLLVPWENTHKLSYERIFIASTNNLVPENADLLEKIILAVPSQFHSQKPPIYELLEKLAGKSGDYLELFARNLQRDWHSWGNEALYFQHESFFVKKELKEK